MRNVMGTMLKLTAVALLALGLVAFISACGGSSGGSDETATGEESASAAGHSEGKVETVGDELVVTMRMENVKFMPDTITVKVGQTVRLRLDNHDSILHDYTVDEPEFVVLEADGATHDDHEVVAASDDDHAAAAHDDDHEVDAAAQVSLAPLHVAAEGDEHAELVFEATEPGEYVFYCSVPGHREAGMEGKIIVEE